MEEGKTEDLMVSVMATNSTFPCNNNDDTDNNTVSYGGDDEGVVYGGIGLEELSFENHNCLGGFMDMLASDLHRRRPEQEEEREEEEEEEEAEDCYNFDRQYSQTPPPAAELSAVFTAPVATTPNSPSISSLSTDDHRRQQDAIDEEGDNKNPKRQLKAKKEKTKRQREPRFAFMTKSEVDHLDDGFRWRKYGQKAVKNSPFPRSYYRCTNASCGVKKRVERSTHDPSVVVTTYEGIHKHPCPVTPYQNGSVGVIMSKTASFAGGSGSGGFVFLQPHQQLQQLQLYFDNKTPDSGSNTSAKFLSHSYKRDVGKGVEQKRIGACPSSTLLLRDQGLLQDIVPKQCR